MKHDVNAAMLECIEIFFQKKTVVHIENVSVR